MSLIKRALEMKDSNPQKAEILKFLGGTVNIENLDKVQYIGKSKKIQSENVYLIKKGSEKSKIKDEFGNEATVVNTQLIF